MTELTSAPVATGGRRSRNDQQDRASFYLTGHRMDTHLGNVEGLGLRSAHFAPYRRLTELRYDYPLVLADGHDVHATMWSLSGLVDDLLARVATGDDAGRVRHHAITLEREIRVRADAGAARLSAAWDEAVDALLAASAGETGGEPDPELADSLARLTAARTVDGELVTCGHDTPREVVGHLWGLVQRERERHLTARVAHLRDDLQDILDAEQASSPAGLAGDRLAASLGPVVGAELDTDALSRMLTDNRPRFALSDSRRARVQRLLDVLTTQRFVPSGEDGTDEAPELYDFVYTDVQAALAAHRERFAATTELAKALVMAEMEADGRYREETHDALFEKWSVADLDTDTLELFPEYLVRVDAEAMTSEDSVALLEALASGLPIKALVQVNDLLRGATQQARPAEAGLSARMLASTALASGESFVMQCASSALYHARDKIVAGSSAPGAALFVVYSGEGEWLDELPHYLAAAAAIESRVFPSYAYDPGAGDTWADRFTLGCNPQPELDWPVRRITYQDDAVQRVALDVPFTAADFWACDARLVTHLALAADDGLRGQGGAVRRARGVEPGRVGRRAALPADDLPRRAAAPGAGRPAAHPPHPAQRRAVAPAAGARAASTTPTSPSSAPGCGQSSRRSWPQRAAAPAARPRRPPRRARRRSPTTPRTTSTSPRPTTRTCPGSRPRAARPATSAPRSTTGCSSTTTTGRPTSPTRTRAPTPSWCSPRRAVRSRSSTPASPGTPTSRTWTT